MSVKSAEGLAFDITTENLDVLGNLDVVGTTQVDDIGVLGTATLQSGVVVFDQTTLEDLEVLGVTEVDDIFISGNIDANGSLDVLGTTILRDTLSLPQGRITMTDDGVVPTASNNLVVMLGAYKYDQNLGVINTGHVFKDNNNVGGSIESAVITVTSARFSGVISSGNTAVTLENTPATQSIASGSQVSVYSSGVLPIGVYMVSTSCVFIKAGPAYLTYASVNITNSVSIVAMTGGEITVGQSAQMSEWGGQATLLWTSTGTNQFIIRVQADTGDGTAYTLGIGGRTQYMKIA